MGSNILLLKICRRIAGISSLCLTLCFIQAVKDAEHAEINCLNANCHTSFFSGEDYADEEFSVRERICRGFARNLYLNILILSVYLCKVWRENYVKWWKEMNIEWNMQTVRRRTIRLVVKLIIFKRVFYINYTVKVYVNWKFQGLGGRLWVIEAL